MKEFIENYCPICKLMTKEFLKIHVKNHYERGDKKKVNESFPNYVRRMYNEDIEA